METILVTEKNFSRLKEFVKNNKDKKIIYYSTDDELNRKVIEKLPVFGIMTSLEDRKDYSKQRDSGFNEIILKIMKRKDISLYIDFEEVIKSKFKERILSRIKQNIFLCNKEKVKLRFYFRQTKRDILEMKSFLASLGAPTWMVSSCFD